MSCDKVQKAATEAAKQNGTPKQANKLAAIEAASQKESLPELLSGETANVRCLLTLKNSKATIPASQVVKLFELEPDQPIAEAVEGLGDRFGPAAHLAVGKSTLGILTHGQKDTYGIQDVFITVPPTLTILNQGMAVRLAHYAVAR